MWIIVDNHSLSSTERFGKPLHIVGGESIYTINEVAEKFHYQRSTVWRWIKNGKIEAVKVGGQWRITEQALVKFLGYKPEI